MTSILRQVNIADYNLPPDSKRTYFAKSRAYEKIYEELYNYTTKKMGGGAVLISGHRGAGKTTLVNKVIKDVTDILAEKKINCRPLLIPLHGPNLLDPKKTERTTEESPEKKPPVDPASSNNTSPDTPAGDKTTAKKTSEEAAADKAESNKDKDEKIANQFIKNVLEHLTISLYRALADEFFETFQKRIKESDRAAELKELVGLLRLELDESSDVSTLRAIWDEAGFLDKGLLYPDRHFDQGVQEIVLLAAAAQAFRIVTGVITDTEDRTSDTTKEQTRISEYKVISRDIINGLISLGSGAAVGLGVAHAVDTDLNVLAGGLAGIATAVLSGYTFTSTTKTTIKKGTLRQYKFIRKTDISSLSRELPQLIERMKTLGLAPVFVVDELDKVMPPYEAFGKVIGHLKYLVSDYSFFCFLTDRNYFDFINSKYRENKYPPEYTYFRNRFYVNYSPQNLHSYLDELFLLEQMQDWELKGEAILLECLLLNRATLHTMDLRRELLRSSREGIINMDGIRSRLYLRFPIMMQLAIESIMEEPELIERFEQEPYFVQWITDALYYPMRNWIAGEKVFDMRPEKFEEYMKSRSEFYSQPEEKKGSNGLSNGKAKENDTIPYLDFLRKKLKVLIDLLMDSEKLSKKILSGKINVGRDAMERENMLTLIVNTIPNNMQNNPVGYVLLRPKQEDIYDWCYNYYGEDLVQARKTEDLDQKISFLEDCNNVVKSHTRDQMDLSGLAQVHIINTSPSWRDVENAIPLMKQYVEDNEKKYPNLDSDLQALGELYGMVTAKGKTIAKSFALAEIISSHLDDHYWQNIFDSLRAFDWNSNEDEKKVDRLLREAGRNKEDWDKYNIQPGKETSWIKDFKDIFTSQKNVDRSIDDIHSKWWSTWSRRLLENIKGKKQIFEVNIDDLICVSENYTWARDLTLKLDLINKVTWSDIILRSWNPDSLRYSKAVPEFDDVPGWFVKAAFIQLGFNKVDFSGLDIKETEWLSIDSSRLPNVISPVDEFVLVVTQHWYYGYDFADVGKPFFVVDYDRWPDHQSGIQNLIEHIKGSYRLTSLVVYLTPDALDKVPELAAAFKVEEKNVFVLVPNGGVESKYTVVRNLRNLTSGPQ